MYCNCENNLGIRDCNTEVAAGNKKKPNVCYHRLLYNICQQSEKKAYVHADVAADTVAVDIYSSSIRFYLFNPAQ